MKSHSIIIADADMDCLTSMIRELQHSYFRDREQLDLLENMLRSADVRPPNHMPRNVVGMNSSVRLRDVETQKEEVYTIVFPHSSNASRGLISILAPVGIAMIGHREGQLIEVKAPGGARKFRIEQVTHSADSRLSKRVATDRKVSPPNFTVDIGMAA